MMLLIDGEDVKQAVVERLLEAFPDIAVYKEAKTNVVYPHFFVHQINLIDEGERMNHHILYYSMEIRYRTAADSSTDLKLQQNLDTMGLKLSENFNIMDFESSKVRCIDKSTEKSDGVLLFYFGVRIPAIEVSYEEYVKQRRLSPRISIQKELKTRS